MGDTYKKSKGNAGLEGVQFQLNLLTVFLLNAIHNRKNWKISTENQEAGKFDDLVLELEDKCVLLQAKFKQSKKINKDQLFSCNSKTADFSLPKYFFSYLEVKTDSVEKTVIVCTNTSIDEKGLQSFLTRHVTGPDSMLHYEGLPCQFFTFNENILPDLKANAEVYLEKNLQGKGVDKEVVTDENLKDFLKHFQFFSMFPHGDKLDTIIGQLLFRLNDSSLYRKTSSQEIYKKIEDWFKQPKGEYLTDNRARAMFSEIKSDKYCEELKSYNLSFRHNSLNFTDPTRIFHVNSEGGHLLQTLKVYSALQKNQSKQLYVNPSDAVEVQKCVVEAFGLSRYTFLIIIGTKITEETAIKEISAKLKNILEKYGFKKVILVAEHNYRLSQQIELNDIYHDRPVTFEDLSNECQERLVKEQHIVFQEKEISLEALLATQSREDWARAVNSEILENLIRKKDIKVGIRPSDLNERSSRCYIYRTFERQVYNIEGKKDGDELKEETFRQKIKLLDVYEDDSTKLKAEIFPEEGIYDVNEDVVLISDSAGTGKSTVLTNLAATIKEKSPHLWVIKIELTEYTAILRDSLNNREKSISAMKLLSSRKSTELTNHLERFVFSMNKKVVLMLDGIDEISPDYTELVLNLLTQCLQAANFAKLFITTRPHMVRALEVVLRVKPFVLQPFTHHNQVDFLTRYWVHNLNIDREDKDKCEQYARALISRMSSWTKGSHPNEDDFTAIPLQLGMLAEIFQESIKWYESSSWEGCKEYLDETRLEPKLPEKMEIKRLYDMFIEKKRDIYIYKANPSGNSAANKALMGQFDESLTYHRILALEVVLHQKDCQLFSCYRQSCKDIDESFLKIGIIQKSNTELQFIHRTFAEYFVTESLIHELQLQLHNPNSDFQELFIDRILTSRNYRTIRSFLENFLKKLINFIPANIFGKYQSHAHYPNYWTQGANLLHLLGEEGCTATLELILKCVGFKIITGKEINSADLQNSGKEINFLQSLVRKIGIKRPQGGNVLKVVRILVREGGVNIKDKYGRAPLHYAASGGHFEMVKFLGEHGAKIDSVDKDGHTPLHLAAATNDLDGVKYLIKSSNDVNVKDNIGLTPLHFACANGQLDTIKFFLGLGVDFHVEDNYNRSLVHLASSEGYLDIVKFLLGLGADLNVGDTYGRTPLHLAASNGYLDIVRLFLEHGVGVDIRDNYNRTPLHLAASNGHLDTVRSLLEMGVKFNVRDSYNRTPLHLAASNGHLDTVKLFLGLGADFNIEDNYSHTPLHLAVSNGHLDTVKFLLGLGADFNARDYDGCTAIHLAASNGHLDTVEFFLGLGADFNAEDNYKHTPLHLASSNGHLDTVKFLLELGADFNARNLDGRTPLHLAASNGHLDTVKFLLELGADFNVRNRDGRTPLHLAASNGQLDTVKFLLELGADINLRDREGNTALIFATNNGHLDTVKFLEDQGADTSTK